MKLVFLLEEPSMKYLLEGLLPRILPKEVEYQLIPHSGKSELRKSRPRNLRGWNEPGDIRFVIIHDQDKCNCVELKNSLRSLCENTKRPVLIRIPCHELEAWYFGDVHALALAYNNPKLETLSKQRKYRIPDEIISPKEELYKIIPAHQQIEGAKKIAPYMSISDNTSTSFQVFVNGVRRFSDAANQ